MMEQTDRLVKTDADLLARAEAAARRYAEIAFKQSKHSCDAMTLRMLALGELRHQNIGVKRDGYRFLVDEEALTTFVATIKETVGPRLVILPTRAAKAKRVDWGREDWLLMRRAGLLDKARTCTSIAQKAKLIEEAGQVVIQRENDLVDAKPEYDRLRARDFRARQRIA